VVVIGDGGEVVPVGPRQLRHRLSEAERTRHAAFIATLGGGGAVWRDYLGEEETA
jgi:DNA polymerase-3 subunit epsilon